ncbi:MAG: helix-turn-helix transcriptional regulator [Clostridia bacterium]|nr:helix-turn-helix transcriptional regulator [Clostridia bacterium]
MAVSADWLRGYTDAILLRELQEGDSYGYEIQKHVSALSKGTLQLKEATLYTAFRRLEQAGYISSYWGDEMQGARRRYYHLTPQGEEKLREEKAQWRETRKTLSILLGEDGYEV